MVNVSKMFAVLGFLLILFAILLKLGNAPLMVGTLSVRLISLLVLANTSLILAILLKK